MVKVKVRASTVRASNNMAKARVDTADNNKASTVKAREATEHLNTAASSTANREDTATSKVNTANNIKVNIPVPNHKISSLSKVATVRVSTPRARASMAKDRISTVPQIPTHKLRVIED